VDLESATDFRVPIIIIGTPMISTQFWTQETSEDPDEDETQFSTMSVAGSSQRFHLTTV